MRSICTQLICLVPLSSYFFTATAAVISSPSNINAIITTSSSALGLSPNLTFLDAIEPARFKIGLNYGARKLPPTSVLMNVVDVMVQLALDDFQGQMGRKTFTLDLPRYSQIEIYISPWDETPSATLHPGFAVLGLFETILNILSDPTQRFKSVKSTFFYDNLEVGWLMMRNTAGAASASAVKPSKATVSDFPTFSEAAQLLNSTESATDATDVTALSVPAWEDSHLRVSYVQGLDTFTIYEIFFSVIASLRQWAPYDQTAQVPDFTIVINTPPITTAGQPIVISFKKHDTPPRTASNPPYFQWQWLIKAFGQLPQCMLDSRDFRDVLLMELRVDGIPIGGGYIVRQQAGLEGVLGVSSNLTTA